ncbi:hypothetical protein [Deinococcus sonorensis]|uniref:Uncharacterized protein n=2 Tax=Deinococcus sonorensis TaxID=309891 RepID=A0AAU7UC39_9DEIO
MTPPHQDDAPRLYVLRIWFEHDGLLQVWRASIRLQDQRRAFSSPHDLLSFLEAEVARDGPDRNG